MNKFYFAISGIFLMFASNLSIASEFDTDIPILEKDAITYYVAGNVDGYGDTDFMVDTGSGYTAINQKMLNKLHLESRVEYLTTVSGIMANGERTILSVYKIDRINIGGKCVINDIKAVILPGSTRNILGLSALKKAAPFAVSINPPKLMLSNCKAGNITL